MTWWPRLWFVGAWWLAAAMGVLGFYSVESDYPNPYTQPITAAVNAAEASGLTFTLAGAAAALLGARLRAAGPLVHPSPRPTLVVLSEAVLPLFITAGLVTMATITWGQAREHALGWPGPGLVVVYASILWAVTCWGLALGMWLRGWIAAPTALIATFLVLGFPPAMNPLWLRHLFGVTGCCGTDQTVDARVLWASTTVAVGAAAGALLVARASPAVRLHRRSVLGALPAAAAVQAAALLIGASLVHDLTSQSATARPGEPRCAAVTPTTTPTTSLCLWPEHELSRGEYAPIVEAVTRIENRNGLTQTAVFTEKGTRDDPSTAPLEARPERPLARRVEAVVSALASGGNCFDPQGNQLTPGPLTWDMAAQLTLERWWTRQLSAELSVPIELVPDAAPDDLLKGIDTRTQAEWIDAVTAARRTCRPSFPPGDAR